MDNTSGPGGGAFWLYERSATMINTVIARNLGGSNPSDITFWGASSFTAHSTNNLIGTGGAGNLVNDVCWKSALR